jgi:sulfide:quinone oxidoreductase
MNKPRVLIIGAGPGGLAAARLLASSDQIEVTLLQRHGVATYLPGILPVILGLRPPSAYHRKVDIAPIQLVADEVISLESGHIRLASGITLQADAIIAAPGLVTDTTPIPAGTRTFPIWELAAAAAARQALHSLTTGRIVIAISSLPYRCPPAPYGLAFALKALFQQRGQNIEVILTTPETRPIQTLGEQVSHFLEQLASAGNVTLLTAFQPDHAACRDGLLVAVDGRRIPYDLGLFVPPHRRPLFLADLPGNGPLVQVDPHLRAPLERTWIVGDVAATPLPRAMGAAEAQGRTAAADLLAALGLGSSPAPATPTLSCYVWTSPSHAARIQVQFPNGLPPAGAPAITLEPPDTTLQAEALLAAEQWAQQLG